MNLRTLLPLLSDDLLKALEAADVTTAEDILDTQPTQIYQALPAGIVSLRELTDLKAQVAQRVSAPATRADKLFKLEEERENLRERCLCGVDELDALLGGFGGHRVYEIAGDKKSGKTGLVLQIVLRHLSLYPDHTVLWLDTGGEFIIERAADILQLNPGMGSETALDRLNVSNCFDAAFAHRVVEELWVSIAREREGRQRTRFLVIDPITRLFKPILNAISSEGHAIMTTLMRNLASIARNHALTVLVTNNSVQSLPQNPYSAFPTTTTKPALGPSFMFHTDETLWLSSAISLVSEQQQEAATMGAKVFIAEVFRSHSTLSKTWCAFVIRNGVSLERFVLPEA